MSPLYPYPRIHCHYVILVGEQGIDVEFLNLGGKSQKGDCGAGV